MMSRTNGQEAHGSAVLPTMDVLLSRASFSLSACPARLNCFCFSSLIVLLGFLCLFAFCIGHVATPTNSARQHFRATPRGQCPLGRSRFALPMLFSTLPR